MPALVLFGRRWHLGSDDLVLPSIIDFTCRVIWLVMVVVAFWKENPEFEECAGVEFITAYLYTSSVLLHVIIIIDLAIFHTSKSGTIMNEKPRKNIPLLLYIRFTLYAIEVLLGISGAFLSSQNKFGCERDHHLTSLANDLILTNLIAAGIATVIFLLTFDPLGKSNEEPNYGYTENDLPETFNSKLWTFRCKLLGCAFNRKNEPRIRESFQECGRIIGFGLQDVDLVPSDLTAALILLFQEEMSRKKKITNSNLKALTCNPMSLGGGLGFNNKKILSMMPIIQEQENIRQTNSSLDKDSNWSSIPMLSHYLKYGVAGYTAIAVYFSRKNPWKRLWENMLCCSCITKRSHPVPVEGDNCCFCHTSGLKDIIEDDFENIVYASFHNDYFKSPFYVALDHKYKAVVISIRPSLSYKDFITDLTCWPKPMNIEGVPTDFMCHNGIRMGAQLLREKLDSLDLPNKLFKKYPDYNLVLTGDSLGAATAVILGFMLRPRYPKLRVYAYSPPGGLLSDAAAEYCNDFVVSITYGDDIIARLSILACEDMKYRIINAMEKSDKPKHQIMLSGFWMACGGRTSSSSDTNSDEEFNGDIELGISDKNSNIIMPSNDNQYKNDDKIEAPDFVPPLKLQKRYRCVPLLLPGKIFHIKENYSLKNGDDVETFTENNIGRWNVRWAHRDEFAKMIVSTRMILDHMPFRMKKALEHFTALQS